MKVIAPVDGSGSSKTALAALRAMHWHEGTEIKLLAAVRPIEVGLPMYAHRAGQASEHHGDAVNERKSQLQVVAAEVQSTLTHCKITAEVASGDAKSIIVDAAREWQADLIVMGSRGNKGFDLILLGSVSQGVVLHSPCPVIVVKGQEAVDGFDRVLITTDSSPYARAAFEWVLKMPWPEKTQFKLVTAVPSLDPEISADESAGVREASIRHDHEKLREVAETELGLLAQELCQQFSADRVSTEIGAGDPREVILDTASAFNADLIVMGAHGRSGVTRLLMGSVSQTISVQAPHSVAIIRGLVPTKEPWQKTGAFTKTGKNKAIKKND